MKIESEQNTPVQRFLGWIGQNRFIQGILSEGPFPHGRARLMQDVEGFSRNLLGEIGVSDHPLFSDELVERHFVNQLAANIIEKVFFQKDPQDALDGRKHSLSQGVAIDFLFDFSRAANISVGQWDDEEKNRIPNLQHQQLSAMDLEARYILLTSGYLSLFVNDFLSEIHGRKTNHFPIYGFLNLREGISLRLDKLESQIEKMKQEA